MKFEAIIFTKNRAMQLDLLLRSMQLNVPDYDPEKITIFYNIDSREMRQSYLILKSRFPDMKWRVQNNFKKSLKDIINNVKTDYVLGLCDDLVFINYDNLFFPYDINPTKCQNLFLTPDSNWNFAQNKIMIPPKIIYIGNDLYVWNWTEIKDRKCDFAYSHNIVGHIYRTKYFQELLKWSHLMSWEISLKRGLNFINWNGVNSLESAMSRWRRKSTPYMICTKKQILLHVAVNTVQTEWKGNEVGNKQDQSVENLC